MSTVLHAARLTPGCGPDGGNDGCALLTGAFEMGDPFVFALSIGKRLDRMVISLDRVILKPP
jgi:hypothetical protein